jgi:hypothetical protein
MMKKILVLSVLVIIVGVGAFYWYEYRPSKASAECALEASKAYKEPAPEGSIFGNIFENNDPLKQDDATFKSCMRLKGFIE